MNSDLKTLDNKKEEKEGSNVEKVKESQ